MATVVLVQRSREDAALYAEWLSGQGHSFLVCGGPAPPDFLCTFLRQGSCRLWEVGDIFVYDAWLDASREEANSQELVTHLRARYPSQPLLVVGPNHVTPTWVQLLAKRDPLVLPVFPVTREGLIAGVGSILYAGREGAVRNA